MKHANMLAKKQRKKEKFIYVKMTFARCCEACYMLENATIDFFLNNCYCLTVSISFSNKANLVELKVVYMLS